MAQDHEDNNSSVLEDDSDFIELCPDTSEFAEDESLVQELTAAKSGDAMKIPRSSCRPSCTVAKSPINTTASSDESDEEDCGNGRKRRRRSGRHSDRNRNKISCSDFEHSSGEGEADSDKNVMPDVRASVVQKKDDTPSRPAIYINKNFKGSVQAAPGTCLAWDSDTLNNGVHPQRAAASGRNSAFPRQLNPQFTPPFRGPSPRAPLLPTFNAGLPFFAFPPFRAVSQLSRMQAAQLLQERFLAAAFGGLPRPLPPFPGLEAMRRNNPRSQANQFRPPNF